MMLLEEMVSIFLTPYLLLFVVPERVNDILQFIEDFTVNVEGVGHVCSFSAFNFENHGNSNYGSPYNAIRTQRSSQGKMEKSFFSFQSSYPSWEPNAQGKQFLLNLKNFREQKMQGYTYRLGHSPPRMWQGSPNLRCRGDGNIFSREITNQPHVTGHHMCSMWLNDTGQQNHAYLLDMYYNSRPHNVASLLRDVSEEPFEVDEHQATGYWMPSNLTQNARYNDIWQHHDEGRLQSDLEASTSAPFFRESMLLHHDDGNLEDPTRNHWWARRGLHNAPPQASFLEPPDFNRHIVQSQTSFLEPSNFNHRILQPQKSFLEPPDFNHHNSDNYYDNFSDRILEEEDGQLEWRTSHGLSRTTYGDDDLEQGDVNLHFDDVYVKPPDSPKINSKPPSLG